MLLGSVFRVFALGAVLFLAVPVENAEGVTTNLLACDLPTVQAAVNAAAIDDVIVLPALTCTWPDRLIINQAITLQGTGDPKGVAAHTIIQDGGTSPQRGALEWTCVEGEAHRLTGIEFADGGRTGTNANGVLRITCFNTGGTTFRIDNNKFNNLKGLNIRPDRVIGVVDNNEFINPKNQFAIQPFDNQWNKTGIFGDASWAAPLVWGSQDFLFVENNIMTVTGTSSSFCTDGSRGMRAVFRFNTLTNCLFVVHGTEASGRQRGGVGIEIYKNTLDGLNQETKLSNIRSGSALIWGNTSTNLRAGSNSAALLTQDRAVAVFSAWLGADGTGPWDVNDPANPIVGGLTATSQSPLNVTDNTQNWTVDQWVGYTVRNTNCTARAPNTGNPNIKARFNCHGIILSNTNNTLTFLSPFFDADLAFAVGDGFEINRVLQVLDGIGRGEGTIINGTPPVVPAGFNDQVTVPIYEWDNPSNQGDLNFIAHASCTGTCRENEHFYNHKPGTVFDGTVGVGSGPIGNRPATCTTGVWYWANDEGEWDATNGATPDGRGYQCTAPNVWTLAYTPFPYPHALTGALVAPTITTQPPNQSVVEGNTATFSVGATGNEGPTYVWRRGGVAIVPAATGSTYTTPATTIAGDNGAMFDVVVTNSQGTVTSSMATLTVTPAGADIVPPTITSILRQVPLTTPTNAFPVVFRVTFDETVVNVDAADFAVSGTATGTAVGTVTPVSGAVYDVQVTGGSAGTVDLDLAMGQNIADASANALVNLTPGTEETYTITATAPTITSILRQVPLTTPTNAFPVVFRVTFNVTVVNVDVADFAVSGTATGTAVGTVTPVSGAVYDVQVTGGSAGTVDLDLAMGQNIADGSANALVNLTPGTEETYTIETTAPTITSILRQVPLTTPTNAFPVVFRATFDETVVNVDAADFAVSGTATGTAVGTVTPVSGAMYDVQVTGGAQGTVDLDMAMGEHRR